MDQESPQYRSGFDCVSSPGGGGMLFTQEKNGSNVFANGVMKMLEYTPHLYKIRWSCMVQGKRFLNAPQKLLQKSSRGKKLLPWSRGAKCLYV